MGGGEIKGRRWSITNCKYLILSYLFKVLSGVESAAGDDKFDTILCVAGGWAGGSAKAKAFVKNADLVWKQSVW